MNILERIQAVRNEAGKADWQIFGKDARHYKLDFLWCRVRYGFAVEQYFANYIYSANHKQRQSILSVSDAYRICEKMHRSASKEEIRSIGNKYYFNETFRPWVKRDYILTNASKREEILAFIERHPSFLVKELSKTQGQGIYKMNAQQALQGEKVEEFLQKRLLLEEIVEQHPALSVLNPSSVNTIRFITVLDSKKESHIVGCSLRIGGKDQIVDNFHNGGVGYPIDPKTGIVCGPGNVMYSTERVIRHPSTNQIVVGLQIPHWDQVVSGCLEAARHLDKLRLIGWDVAITSDGVEFIEANIGAGPTIIQTDGIGKKHIVYQCLYRDK